MTLPNQGPTTIHALIDRLFGVRVETRDNPLVAQAATTVTQILRANPSRVALSVVNLGSNSVFLWSDALVSSTRGIRLTPNGGEATVLYDEDFTRVGYEWNVIASGGASEIAVQEVLIGS